MVAPIRALVVANFKFWAASPGDTQAHQHSPPPTAPPTHQRNLRGAEYGGQLPRQKSDFERVSGIFLVPLPGHGGSNNERKLTGISLKGGSNAIATKEVMRSIEQARGRGDKGGKKSPPGNEDFGRVGCVKRANADSLTAPRG